MTPLNRTLLIVLGVQLALAVVTNWPAGGPKEPRDLLDVPSDEIQSVTVSGRKLRTDEPGESVKLARSDAGWVIASEEDYPASDALVQPLLDNLGKIKVTDPIATTTTSQASLEVASDAYTRLVEVTTKGGVTKKLYLGSGQGKSTAVRLDGENEVYEVSGFTAWSVAEHANRYFDRDITKFDPADVDEVTVQRPGQPLVTFTQTEGVWTMSPNPSGKALDATATTGFIRGLVNLRMVDPHGKAVTPEMNLDPTTGTRVSWKVTSEDPPQTNIGSYVVGAEIPDQNGRYYVKLDGSPYVLEVLKGNVQNAIEKPMDTVFGAPPPG